MRLFLLILFLLNTHAVAQDSLSDEFEMELNVNNKDSVITETLFVTEEGDTVALDSLAEYIEVAIEKQPELVEFVNAVYPPQAMKQGIEGTVLMEFIITDSGLVESVKVVHGAESSLDSAAVRAMRKFTFTPALAGGKPIPVISQYPYKFFIEEEIKEIKEYVNYSGVLKEKGTRALIQDGMVVLSFPDTITDTSLTVPWKLYLKRLGEIPGQRLEEGRLVTYSDSTGRFSFTSLPLGEITVTFPLTGYKMQKHQETIEKGTALDITYWLERTSYNEYEIVVYGKAEQKEVAKKTLSLHEVKRIPGFGGDAVKVIQALPGVARPIFSSALIIIRGSSIEDTRYFLDGIEIPNIFHIGGIKSTYNSDLLSSVDLYPGGFNTRYGGAIGGIIEVKSRPAKTDRVHGKVDVNLIDATVLAEGPLKDNVGFSIAARRSYVDVILKKATKNLPTTVIPVYWDMVSRLDYKRDPHNRMFWTYFSAYDKLDIIIGDNDIGSSEVNEATNTLTQATKFHTGIFGWDREYSETITNNMRFAFSKANFASSIFGFANFDFNVFSYYLRNQLTWSPTKAIKHNVGLDMDVDRVIYDIVIATQGTGIQASKQDKYFTNLGAYYNVEFSPMQGILFIPGVRYDYFNEIEEGKGSLRLTTRYEYKLGHTLKSALGNYSQTPKPLGRAIDETFGNPELPATKANHYVAGYEWQITDLIHLDIQSFFNYQSNIPRFTDALNIFTGQELIFLPDMNGRMYGLEIMLRHETGQRFFGWLAYTLSRSERRAPGPTTPSFGFNTVHDPEKWYLFPSDQTHILQLIGQWKLPRHWETGFRFRYVTGNPHTPYLSFTNDIYEHSADEDQYVDLFGEAFSERIGPFVQLDMRVDKKFIFKTWTLSMYLDVQNINYFWYNSPEFYIYNFNKNERNTVGSIIIPALGIEAHF